MSRFGSLKRIILSLAVIAIVSIVAGTAKADVVVVTGVNNQGTDNVLLNPATNVLTVTGTGDCQRRHWKHSADPALVWSRQ
jgi:hypothetical protein